MKRICPACGSRNTAKIFYGYPMLTDELSRKLDEGIIKLGGCCIDSFSPKYFCIDCRIDFDTDITLMSYSVYKIYFRIGSWNSPKEYTFSQDEHGNIIVDGIFSSLINLGGEMMQWDTFVKKILSCHVLDWQDTYIDENILDGIQWDLRIYLENGEIIEKGGSNAYPPHWKKLTKIISNIK